MTSMIVKAGVAALIAFTGLSATAPTAAAAGSDFAIQVQYRDRDRDWRPDRGGDRDWRPDRGPRGCSPWLAEEKASRMGLRRARVVDAGRRVVIVAGFGRRGPDRIVFANERGCPVIRR
ncbi:MULTISPECIES: hypothetical protein [Neorhizobium]|jgi:hypothetical protein|uniref:hypothetical protein n=1 Tax=Neorhizobium sp. T6_25 TaxID=2093833 RepID=UPI000CF85A95|nr:MULTISPECIES: hypothetical protein [Neorhizobium]